MIKYKVLSLLGFVTGTALILVTSPPTLFDDNAVQDGVVETKPVIDETAVPSPSPSVTPSSTVKVTTSPTPKPLASSSSSATKSTTPTISTKTFTGNTYAAGKYGNVQVQIVMTNGIVTSAKALIFPNSDSRSSSISAMAIPILTSQTLAAKNSSSIQGATGASYTSAAWIDSLQSALAKI